MIISPYIKRQTFITHPESSKQLCRSHITQYRCSYCKLEYLREYYVGTLDATVTRATMHPLVSSRYCNLQCTQWHCVICDLCCQSEGFWRCTQTWQNISVSKGTVQCVIISSTYRCSTSNTCCVDNLQSWKTVETLDRCAPIERIFGK